LGFFAVIGEADQPDFRIAKLDINVWCLPGLVGRNVVSCDVGLQIHPASELGHLALGVPFGTLASGLVDLAPLMQDSIRTAGLVFGRPCVLLPTGSRTSIDYGAGIVNLGVLDVGRSQRDERRSNENFTLWHIVIAGGAPAHTDTYVRLRFAVESLGRAWTWQRSLGVRHSAVIDLRVNDLRETQTVPDGADYQGRVVDIEELNCHVITPAVFRTLNTSPETRYVRLLEGQVWEPYLRRATDLRRSGKLIVSCWRAPGGVRAPEDGFRIFLALRREGWTEFLALFIAAVLAVLVGTALLSSPSELRASPIASLASTAWDLTGVRISLGVAALLAATATILKALTGVGKRLKRLRQLARSAEAELYRLRARL
jgi:hypothetical protein